MSYYRAIVQPVGCGIFNSTTEVSESYFIWSRISESLQLGFKTLSCSVVYHNHYLSCHGVILDLHDPFSRMMEPSREA
jgi:hypothetical protein